MRAYDTASNSNTETQGELVLDRNRDGRDVFCGISHDGEEDQADELLRDPATAGQAIDRIDKPLGSDRHKDGDKNEKTDGHRERQFGYFLILVVLLRSNRTRSFLVRDLPWLVFSLTTDDMSAAICRSHARTVLLGLFHGGERKSKQFLRPFLRTRPGVLGGLELLTALIIVQALMGKELEDEVREVNLQTQKRRQ